MRRNRRQDADLERCDWSAVVVDGTRHLSRSTNSL
jgi:hypothetical protein